MTSIVVLHQGAIGDFLLALSVLQPARAALGADRLTAIASAPSAMLASGHSAVDVWISPESIGLYRLFRRDLDISDRLRGLLSTADCILNFTGGADEVVHERLSAVASGRIVSVDPRPSATTRTDRRHITAQWTEAIRAAGLAIGEPLPAVIRLHRSSPRASRRIVVHPGSGSPHKCWPFERFAALADRLTDADLVWMLGPAEGALARRVAGRDEPTLVESDLARAAERLAAAAVYVGNDSGITHLAAALGLPCVAIFTTTDPCIWRPLGGHVTALAPPAEDEPVEVDAVFAAVEHLRAGR